MKRLKYLITAAIIVIIVTAAAFGADAPAAATPAVSPVPAFLQATIFPLLTALFMGFVTRFLNQMGAKYKIEALTQKGNFLEQLAFQGISFAEEQAAKYVGSKAVLSGTDKLSLAVGYIMKAMPTVTPEQAENLVHALLAQISGAGATGDKALAAPGTGGSIGGLAAFSASLAPPAEEPEPAAA